MMGYSEAYLLCKQHEHRYVGIHMEDGTFHDGIVEMVDEESLYLAVPAGYADQEEYRAFAPGFGYPFGGFSYPFPYPYPYPYPFFPRRRFVRQVLPLAALLAISLLPYY